jgi:hypothetical protein
MKMNTEVVLLVRKAVGSKDAEEVSVVSVGST